MTIIIMFKYYTSADYRKVYSIIERIELLSSSKNNVKYSQISETFIGKTGVQDFFLTALNIMQNQKLNPQKSLKFISFVHIGLQNYKNFHNIDKINSFLSHLLRSCDSMIQKQSLKSSPYFTTDHIINPQKSPLGSNNIRSTTRNSSDRVSKQLYLSLNIIKPYLTYLFKLLSVGDFYNQCKSVKKEVDFNEGWALINIFKLIEAVVKNFNHIGRYYFRQYETCAVLMTQCFCRDIQRFYPKIKKLLSDSVSVIQYKFECLSAQFGKVQVYDKLNIQFLDETVKMLQQISNINQNLFQLFMNKYFFQKIEHLQAPDWIQTTQKQFDFVFHVWKIKNKVDSQRVRRGVGKNDPIFGKIGISPIKIRAEKDMLGSSFSLSLIKKNSENENKFHKVKENKNPKLSEIYS